MHVTDEMNVDLMKEFTEVEVKEALNQMAPLKASSPDGMPPLFINTFGGRCSMMLLQPFSHG